MGMQDIWKLEKNIAFCQRLFTLTKMVKQHGDSYIGSKRSKSDYLSVSRQFVTWLTLCIFCLMGKGSDGEMGMLVPTFFN